MTGFDTMARKTLNTVFGLGLAGLIKLLNPSPAQAQDYAHTPSSQVESDRTGTHTAIPRATNHTLYSGLFHIIRRDGNTVCFRQRGERSGGIETHAGREPSSFEDNSTFIHLYKEYTTLGVLTGDAQGDEHVREDLSRLHTRVWNDMYAGGDSLARDDDWEFTWRDGELMGIQVRQDRLQQLREGVHRYARTLPESDSRRSAILHGAIFTRGRHAYWTNGPVDACIEQRHIISAIPDSTARVQGQNHDSAATNHLQNPQEQNPAPRRDSGIDELLQDQEEPHAPREDTREQSNPTPPARSGGQERVNGQEPAQRTSNNSDNGHDSVSIIGGFAHQWVELSEANEGGNYSYRADGNGGRARIYFAGGDVIFSLIGGAYTGEATIDGIAHGTPFHGDASGLDVVGSTNLSYLPWNIGRDLRIGAGGELVFDVRDLHDIVYEITGDDEARDQSITSVAGALVPGLALAYHGDIAMVEAFLGLGPAFEYRTDNNETQGGGHLVGRILARFQAGDFFQPHLEARGSVNVRDAYWNARIGAEAGVLVQLGDVIIGPAGSIDYSHTEGRGFRRDFMDYQVFFVTGFQEGNSTNQR